jgi:hypothetical protein
MDVRIYTIYFLRNNKKAFQFALEIYLKYFCTFKYTAKAKTKKQKKLENCKRVQFLSFLQFTLAKATKTYKKSILQLCYIYITNVLKVLTFADIKIK